MAFLLQLKPWIHAARLRTLPLAISGMVLADFIALYQGVFKWDVAIFALLTTLMLQILSNFANDYGDFSHGTDNENRVGPERAMQSGAITQKAMKRAIYIMGLLAFHFGMFLLTAALDDLFSYVFILFLITGLVAIGAAIKYTVGKKNYGYNGYGDLMVFVFFGIAAVFGTHFLMALKFDWFVLLPASAIGLLSSGVLNVNNMRDIINDKNSGKHTLAVKFGAFYSKIYHLIITVLAMFLLVCYTLYLDKTTLTFSLSAPFILLLIHLIKIFTAPMPKDLDPELKRLSLTTLLISLWVGIGINL